MLHIDLYGMWQKVAYAIHILVSHTPQSQEKRGLVTTCTSCSSTRNLGVTNQI